jgi:hypothetical protein
LACSPVFLCILSRFGALLLQPAMQGPPGAAIWQACSAVAWWGPRFGGPSGAWIQWSQSDLKPGRGWQVGVLWSHMELRLSRVQGTGGLVRWGSSGARILAGQGSGSPIQSCVPAGPLGRRPSRAGVPWCHRELGPGRAHGVEILAGWVGNRQSHTEL